MRIIEVLTSEYKNRYPNKNFLLLRSLLLYYRDPDFRVVSLIRYSTCGNSRRLRKYCCKKLLIKYSVYISKDARIGKNFQVGHYLGLVIGSGVCIGDNCITYQQVTIGQKNNIYPVIGNNVTIFAGAKIIGDVRVGDNSVIGANAVVLSDVPPNSIAVGVPARIINKNQDSTSEKV